MNRHRSRKRRAARQNDLGDYKARSVSRSSNHITGHTLPRSGCNPPTPPHLVGASRVDRNDTAAATGMYRFRSFNDLSAKRGPSNFEYGAGNTPYPTTSNRRHEHGSVKTLTGRPALSTTVRQLNVLVNMVNEDGGGGALSPKWRRLEIKRSRVRSMEQIWHELSELFRLPIKHLFTLDGREIATINDLFAGPTELIATGPEQVLNDVIATNPSRPSLHSVIASPSGLLGSPSLTSHSSSRSTTARPLWTVWQVSIESGTYHQLTGEAYDHPCSSNVWLTICQQPGDSNNKRSTPIEHRFPLNHSNLMRSATPSVNDGDDADSYAFHHPHDLHGDAVHHREQDSHHHYQPHYRSLAGSRHWRHPMRSSSRSTSSGNLTYQSTNLSQASSVESIHTASALFRPGHIDNFKIVIKNCPTVIDKIRLSHDNAGPHPELLPVGVKLRLLQARLVNNPSTSNQSVGSRSRSRLSMPISSTTSTSVYPLGQWLSQTKADYSLVREVASLHTPVDDLLTRTGSSRFDLNGQVFSDEEAERRPVVRYQLTVKTGDLWAAGHSQGQVSVNLLGQYGQSGMRQLWSADVESRSAFKKGAISHFDLEAVYLGQLKCIQISFSDPTCFESGLGSPACSWYLDHLIVACLPARYPPLDGNDQERSSGQGVKLLLASRESGLTLFPVDRWILATNRSSVDLVELKPTDANIAGRMSQDRVERALLHRYETLTYQSNSWKFQPGTRIVFYSLLTGMPFTIDQGDRVIARSADGTNELLRRITALVFTVVNNEIVTMQNNQPQQTPPRNPTKVKTNKSDKRGGQRKTPKPESKLVSFCVADRLDAMLVLDVEAGLVLKANTDQKRASMSAPVKSRPSASPTNTVTASNWSTFRIHHHPDRLVVLEAVDNKAADVQKPASSSMTTESTGPIKHVFVGPEGMSISAACGEASLPGKLLIPYVKGTLRHQGIVLLGTSCLQLLTPTLTRGPLKLDRDDSFNPSNVVGKVKLELTAATTVGHHTTANNNTVNQWRVNRLGSQRRQFESLSWPGHFLRAHEDGSMDIMGCGRRENCSFIVERLRSRASIVLHPYHSPYLSVGMKDDGSVVLLRRDEIEPGHKNCQFFVQVISYGIKLADTSQRSSATKVRDDSSSSRITTDTKSRSILSNQQRSSTRNQAVEQGGDEVALIGQSVELRDDVGIQDNLDYQDDDSATVAPENEDDEELEELVEPQRTPRYSNAMAPIIASDQPVTLESQDNGALDSQGDSNASTMSSWTITIQTLIRAVNCAINLTVYGFNGSSGPIFIGSCSEQVDLFPSRTRSSFLIKLQDLGRITKIRFDTEPIDREIHMQWGIGEVVLANSTNSVAYTFDFIDRPQFTWSSRSCCLAREQSPILLNSTTMPPTDGVAGVDDLNTVTYHVQLWLHLIEDDDTKITISEELLKRHQFEPFICLNGRLGDSGRRLCPLIDPTYCWTSKWNNVLIVKTAIEAVRLGNLSTCSIGPVDMSPSDRQIQQPGPSCSQVLVWDPASFHSYNFQANVNLLWKRPLDQIHEAELEMTEIYPYNALELPQENEITLQKDVNQLVTQVLDKVQVNLTTMKDSVEPSGST